MSEAQLFGGVACILIGLCWLKWPRELWLIGNCWWYDNPETIQLSPLYYFMNKVGALAGIAIGLALIVNSFRELSG